ncbi:glycosyltransferase family 39 protein [Kitasatospora terrestris]|uniref:Glycosyltransferase RgtA/B/C/D-like domain-containing protein n=1 Tax=Kitasatospora terrestris TaxID=258051 RepID=A0ABP9D7N1_9ACTN
MRHWPAGASAVTVLLVGMWRIGSPQLWRDEVSSWSAASRSLGDLFAMLGNVDASNGAYYLLLHGWTALAGDSPTALRLPSAIAMAGTAWFTAMMAQWLFRSPAAGLAAGLLLAVAPSVSRYAQEARSYALVACAVTAALWCLVRALDRPADRTLDRPSWRWWVGFTVCTAVGGVLHLVSLVAVVGQLPLVLAAGRRALKPYAASVAVAVLPVVPLVVLGTVQAGRQLSWIERPDSEDLQFFWQGLIGAHQVMYALLGLVALGLLLPGAAAGTRAVTARLVLLAALPVLLVWLVSQGTTSYFADRYLLFTVPVWAIAAGGGVAAAYGAVRAADTRHTALSGAAATVLAVGLVAYPAHLAVPRERGVRGTTAHSPNDYSGAAELIARGYRSGDELIAAGGLEAWLMIGPALDYYLPEGVEPAQPYVVRSAEEADDLYPVESRVPEGGLRTAHRIWVVTNGTSGDPYQKLTAEQTAALRADFTPTEVRRVAGLTVSLLVRNQQ